MCASTIGWKLKQHLRSYLPMTSTNTLCHSSLVDQSSGATHTTCKCSVRMCNSLQVSKQNSATPSRLSPRVVYAPCSVPSSVKGTPPTPAGHCTPTWVCTALLAASLMRGAYQSRHHPIVATSGGVCTCISEHDCCAWPAGIRRAHRFLHTAAW